MTHVFYRLTHLLFGVQRGELKLAMLMQLAVFLLITTLMVVKPTINGLFLSYYGVEQLPWAFLLVGAAAVGFSWWYSRLVARFSLISLIRGTILSSVVILLGVGVLLYLNVAQGPGLYLFYTWVALFGLLATSQFWLLANMVYDTRQALRIFGFIGSGAIAGGIFGGFLTSGLAHVLGSEKLLFLAAGLILVTWPLFGRVWREIQKREPAEFSQQKKASRINAPAFKLIRSSGLLTYLAVLVGASVIIAKLVDYQFSAMAILNLPDPDALTSFFGFWYSALNVLSLIIQLLLTRRVVGRFGVGFSLLVLPGMILLATTVLFLFPVLWAAVLLKLADGSLKNSLNKAALELLTLPVPLEDKKRVKAFIDILVDSLATALGGLLLIFVVKALDLPFWAVNVLILMLVGVWLAAAWRLRGEFLHAFKSKLGELKPKSKKSTGESWNLKDRSVEGGLRKVLESGEEKQMLYILNKLRYLDARSLRDSIVALLDHPHAEIRVAAIQTLYFFRKPRVTIQVSELVMDPDREVRVAALQFLVRHLPNEGTDEVKKWLAGKDEQMRRAAFVSFVSETRFNPGLRHRVPVDKLMADWRSALSGLSPGAERSELEVFLLRVIRTGKLSAHYDLIRNCLDSEDAAVRSQAIQAACKTLQKDLIPYLLQLLPQPETRPELVEYLPAFGPALVDVLDELWQDGLPSREVIRHFPEVLGRIGRQPSTDLLFRMMEDADPVVRRSALRGLIQLRKRFPNLSFHRRILVERILREVRTYRETLLILYTQVWLASQQEESGTHPVAEARSVVIELLENRLSENIYRIFRYLGLRYPLEDMENIYRLLSEGGSSNRESAIDFLETVLSPDLKKALGPLIENYELAVFSRETIHRLELTPAEEKWCLDTLLKARNPRIRMAVLYLLQQMADPTYIPSVQPLLESHILREKALAEHAIRSMQDQG